MLCSWRMFGALHFLFSEAKAWLLQCRPPLKGMAGEPSLSRASMHLDEVWHYCSVAGRSNFDLLSVLFVWTKCTMGPCNNDHNASPLKNRCIANNTIKSRQQKQWKSTSDLHVCANSQSIHLCKTINQLCKIFYSCMASCFLASSFVSSAAGSSFLSAGASSFVSSIGTSFVVTVVVVANAL